MTFVGRILIAVQLFLSVFFMAFAGAVYTAHTNWKTALDASTKKLSDAQTALSAARNEAENQKTADKEKLDAMENLKNQFEGELNRLKAQYAALEVESKQTRALLDAEREVARLNTEEAQERAAESTLQREKNSQLYNSRNDVFAQLKEAEDKLFSLELQRQQFEQKYNQLLKDRSVMVSFLASKGLPTDPKQMSATTVPPTDVQGVVLEYRKAEKGRNEFVEISLGSDDDLRAGHILTLYNDDKYLGQVRVLTVTPDRSVCLVVAKSPNSTIKRGDNVKTNL